MMTDLHGVLLPASGESVELPWAPPARERRLRLLFDTETTLDARAVLRRTGVLGENPLHDEAGLLARRAGALLAWACAQEICTFDTIAGSWRLLRLDVVFAPLKGDGWADLRLYPPATTAAVVAGAREAGLRVRLAGRESAFVSRMTVLQAGKFGRKTALPDELRAADLPPVETWGEFADNLAGFMPAMPLWRAHEVLGTIVVHRRDLDAVALADLGGAFP